MLLSTRTNMMDLSADPSNPACLIWVVAINVTGGVNKINLLLEYLIHTLQIEYIFIFP